MERKYALIISVILTIIIASDFYMLKYLAQDDNRESAVLSRVIDGDTIELDDGRVVRLLNINSPEKGQSGSDLSKNFLKSFENQSIELDIVGTDKYMRQLARLYANDYLNLEIVKKGFASKFLVDSSELKLFDGAETNAIKKSLGIWTKSNFFGCFQSKIDQKKEIVELTSLCGEINLSGWQIKDESRKIYLLNITIKKKLNLHTALGKDNETDIYWNSNQDIWNNDRDSFYLFDSGNKIAHQQTYGY